MKHTLTFTHTHTFNSWLLLLCALCILTLASSRASAMAAVDDKGKKIPAGGVTSIINHGAMSGDLLDDAAAFNAAIVWAVTNGGGIIEVPAGQYVISKTVLGLLNSESITFRGVAGQRSQIRIATGPNQDGFLFNNGTVNWQDIVFLGTLPETVEDAQTALRFETAGGTFTGCRFYGLRAVTQGGHVISVNKGWIVLRDFFFGGCAASAGGNGSVINADNYGRIEIANGSFIDYGTLDEVFYTKTASAPLAWIRLGKPGISNDALTAPQVVIGNVSFDEGALFAVFAHSDWYQGGLPARSILIEDVRVNVSVVNSTPETGGIYINNAEKAVVRDSWFGFAKQGTHYGVTLENVASAIIDSSKFSANAGRIKAANTVGSLQITNSTYDEAGSRSSLNPQRLSVTSNGATAKSRPIGTLKAAATLNETQQTIEADATSAAFTLTLPPAARATGRIYTIVKIDPSSKAVTLAANGAETINGTPTRVLSFQWNFVTVQSNGVSWRVIGAG